MSILPPVDEPENYEQLRQAIAEAQEKGQTKTALVLLKKLGQAYMDAGDAPQALTEFNEAIKLVSNDSGEKDAFAQLLGLRGLALKLIGNYSLALQAFRKSNDLAREINHPALACDSLINLAALHAEMGKIDQALTVLTSTLEIATQSKDKVRKMRVYGLLGDNFLKQVEPAKALEYYRLAQGAAQGLENRAAECSFVTKMGNVLLLEGKSEPAIEQYERALKLASTLGDRNAEINILGGLFRAYALAGEVHPAQVYGEQAIHLAAQIEHVEAEISNLQALAAFLLEQGLLERVFPLLERGLLVVRQQTNLGLQIELLNLQGQAYSLQEKYGDALESWNAALTLASNLQDEIAMAVLFGRMAAIFAETGELEKSIDCAEKALALAQAIEDPKLAAEQQLLLAFNFKDAGQTEKAAQVCQEAIQIYQTIGATEMAAQAQTLLTELEN